jgi:hypothetical protein
MRKFVLGVMLALCFLGGYTTFAYSHGYHHGGVSIGISPFIAIQPPIIAIPAPPAIVIGGPPVVYEQRYYTRRYVRRRVIRRKAVVQRVATTTQTAVVTQQIPLTPPTLPLPPAPRAVTVTPEIAVAATVVQPVVATETWYYTDVACCYIYFDQQWRWDSDLWYYHHFRGHYYERSPQYWARYGFNEPYWRRYEGGRRYVPEERRWIREGRVSASPVRERVSVQPQWASYDRGRHGGWQLQGGWGRQGGWERHAGHGWGRPEGHGHGHGHGKR